MDQNDSRDIVIAMFQYSIVVKGIERKLASMEYNVTTISEDLENEMKRLAGRVALILIYLPGDILDDGAKGAVLQNICKLMSERDQKLILIGENKYHDGLASAHPGIKDFTWLDRPVDMDVLEQTVIKGIRS